MGFSRNAKRPAVAGEPHVEDVKGSSL